MNLILVNQSWFKNEWLEDGDKIFTVGLSKNSDYVLHCIIHINDILEKLPKDFGTPDAIVIFDNSTPIYLVGLESISIPIYFYSVDIHHHYILHSYLSNVFDATSIAMKDYLPYMREHGNQDVEWLPLWASQIVEPSNEKKYGAVFVGTLNKELNKERVEFFDALKNKIDILCMQGDWWKIFPYSEIVINQTVKMDLNFRVFEAMGSGSLLLTEKSSNGLFDLFQDSVHLITYEKNNVDEAKEKIEYFLNHKKEAYDIALKGREEIILHHLPRHRADFIKSKLKTLTKRQSNRKNLGMAHNFLYFYTIYKDNDVSFYGVALKLAMQYLQVALLNGETIGENDLFTIFKICINFDLMFKTNIGERLVSTIKNKDISVGAEAYHIWNLLNNGQYDKISEVLGVPVSVDISSQLFEKYNSFVCSFIE